jgi:hypothetical protein
LLLACAWLLPLFAACERKPTAEEIEQARRAQEPLATPTPKPTPAPGAWMYDKNRKNPLDPPPRR